METIKYRLEELYNDENNYLSKPGTKRAIEEEIRHKSVEFITSLDYFEARNWLKGNDIPFNIITVEKIHEIEEVVGNAAPEIEEVEVPSTSHRMAADKKIKSQRANRSKKFAKKGN
jgi:hypothetical protein